MEDNILYKEKVVYKALEELDELLFQTKKVRPFELNVIGGFAMTVDGIRLSDYTDIDYIGKDFPDFIKEMIDTVGIQYGLGRGWINNDCLMSGNTLEDLECSVGPLKFNHAFSLSIITINILDRLSLLRMKMVAIDTSFTGIEYGGDFTRIKDFLDIKLLMDSLNIVYEDVVEETFDYIISPEIFFLLRYYLNYDDAILYMNNKEFRDKIIDTKGKFKIIV